MAGIAALWVSTTLPLAAIARTRSGFVLVTTGLLMGLVLQFLLLRAGLGHDLSRLTSIGLLHGTLCSSLMIMGVVNLLLLIRARELLSRPRLVAVVEEVKPRAAGPNSSPPPAYGTGAPASHPAAIPAAILLAASFR